MFLKLQSNNNNNSYQDDTGVNGQCFIFEKDPHFKAHEYRSRKQTQS